MSRAKKEKAAGPAIESREEMERAVGRICELTIRRDELTTRMDEELMRVREGYEAQLADLEPQIATELAAAECWAEENPEQFGGKKSIQMLHGVVGYRTGTPKLKTLRGLTWDAAVRAVRSVHPDYVRVKEEVDKERILAERDILGGDLAKMGVRVVQDETFFVEPEREAVAS